MIFETGDHVEWESMGSQHTFRGQIEGFYGKDGVMAMVTDQTGLGSRPVAIKRLRRSAPMYWYRSEVA